MALRVLILCLMILVPGLASAADQAKFRIKIKIKVNGLETGDSYVIVPEKKYSLSLTSPDTGRSKIALYDKNGNKKEGLYWIANKDLEKIMNKPLADVLKSVQNTQAPKKKENCASCLTDDAQDRQEPTPEPKNAPQAPKVKPEVKAEPRPDVKPVPGDLCSMYQNFVKKGVPTAPLKQAMAYFNQNRDRFNNERYISIADYSQRSDKKRFYMLDLQTGEVVNEKVSHGSGKVGGRAESDPNNDGMVDRCEHPSRVLAAQRNPRRGYRTRENMTRPGFFATGSLNLSQGHLRKWPRVSGRTNSMLLQGLSGRVNGTAGADGVMMHEAYYNFNGNQKMGKSFGCPAFVPGRGAPIMKKINGGSLYYSYVPVCKSDMDYVLKDLPGWNSFCEAK